MAKKRDPAREKAKELYLKSRGKMKTGEIAAAVGKSPNTISKWKRADGWEALNAKKRPGGQPGNKNAVGGGAPGGNQNALKHGAYARARLATFDEEQRAELERVAKMGPEELLMLQISEKWAKKIDLLNRIAALGTDEKKKYFEKEKKIYTASGAHPKPVLTARTEDHVSFFERRRVLEDELARLDGQIDRCIQSLYSMLGEKQRIRNENIKTRLMQYKAAGVVPEDFIDRLLKEDQTDGDDQT
jgi:uncharacterized protein YjcR